MKNKLHKNTIPCHAEQVAERSRSAASHKKYTLISHFQISKLLFLLLFPLWGLGGYAQNYDWNWAISGGSPNGNETASGLSTSSEQIYDIKVGTDGNYYYLATMKGFNLTKLNGQLVTTNNTTLGGEDIFIFSTTCDGQVRWSQAIGGGGTGDMAFSLALDTNNNVFVLARVGLATNPAYPVRFSATETLPPLPSNPTTVSDAWKTSFIVKYNNMGQYQWKKAIQGNVTQDNFESQVNGMVIDSQNNLHFIIGLVAGTHLDGQATVPATFTNKPQYYLVKFNTQTQQFDDVLLLPLDGALSPQCTFFAYHESSKVYYLAGMRANNISAPPTPMTFDGGAFVERSFVLAFNGFNGTPTAGKEVWRREIYSDPNPTFPTIIIPNYITSLVVDTNADVYIAGTLYNYQNSLPIKIYDPTRPSVQAYTFTPGTYSKIPGVIKLNGTNGVVQWAKTPTAHGSNFSTAPGSVVDKGLALRGDEVAFGSPNGYYIWDNFVSNPPKYQQYDATVVRFNKQTGTTVGMHTIKADVNSNEYVTALAVDNDGNYIVGGAFYTTLFNNTNINTLVSSGGNDFYVAKLAASVCGTSVSTEDFTKLNVKVYPNPTTDIVNIETQETLQSYEVYNVLGQQVQKGMFNSNNQINLHGATAGTYFIKVSTQQGSNATVKVVKK